MRKNLLKVFGILGGYGLAFLAGSLAVYINQLRTPADASQGMAAFGDSILFLWVFGFFSLFPTGVVLYLLRPFVKFWTVLSEICFLLALTAPFLAFAMFWGSRGHHGMFWMTMAQIGVLRAFAAPVLALSFLVCAIVTWRMRSRWYFLSAAGLECILIVFILAYWFIPMWSAH